MSNSKKSIKVKSEFSNMYGNGKNLNVGKNKPVNELLKNIQNSNLNKNVNSNENIQNDIQRSANIQMNSNKTLLERKETLPIQNSSPPVPSPFKLIYIAIIILILLIITLLIFYKDMFIQFFNNIFSKPDTAANAAYAATDAAKTAATNAATTSSKVDNTAAKVDVTSAKVESTSAKIDDLDKKVDKLINSKECSSNSEPAINKLNDKLNNVSPYKKTTLSEDAYCYIGYDNGQRECIEAYAGDVCMSGEIFPSLDICINPKLRT